MKINTKIILLIVGSLVLSSVTLGLLYTWQMSRAGQMAVSRMNDLNTDNVERIKIDPEKMKQELIDRKKEYLKSQVQTIISVLEKAYEDAHDPEKIVGLTVDFVLHPVAFSLDENGLGMV